VERNEQRCSLVVAAFERTLFQNLRYHGCQCLTRWLGLGGRDDGDAVGTSSAIGQTLGTKLGFATRHNKERYKQPATSEKNPPHATTSNVHSRENEQRGHVTQESMRQEMVGWMGGCG
jgi:hypothetical protein